MSDGKLNVAFVRRGYSASGGAEAYLKRLASGLAEFGHVANLIATNEWPANEWPFGPITRVRGESPIAFADEVEKLRQGLQCEAVMSLERVWHCDVYRAGDGVHRAWLNRRRRFEMPLQRFVRGINRKHQDILRLEESLFKKAGAGCVIANSEMVKREIVDVYRYPADKIDVVRTGIPLDKFRFDSALREKSRAELKLKPDDIVLLFAGSGWGRKGLRFAIEAFELSRDKNLRLLVVGRGDQSAYRPKRFFTEEPVRFLGEIADVLSVYAAADIFILPTIYDPFSNACLEALGCGLPVITTRDNGFSEIIEDSVHGSVVDTANNVAALRDSIRFWCDESRRTNARAGNAAHASQFDIAKNVQATLSILVQSVNDSTSRESMTKT